MTPAATTAYRQRPYIDAHPTHATTIRSQPISSLDRATRRTSNRRSMLARDGDQLQTELGETSAEPWYLRLSAKTLIFHKGSVLGLASLTRTQTRSVAQPRHQEFRIATEADARRCDPIRAARDHTDLTLVRFYLGRRSILRTPPTRAPQHAYLKVNDATPLRPHAFLG